MDKKIKGMRLFVTVVDRLLGNKIVKLFEEVGCHFHQIIYGKGTAPSEIYEYLGFGDIEKEVVLSIASCEIVPLMIEKLKTKMNFDKEGYGIAFSIPLDSVAGKSVIEEIIMNKRQSENTLPSKEEK